MLGRPISSPTDCPQCRHDTATLFLEGVSPASVTYRCLYCGHAYKVLTGDLPEVVRTVILMLLQGGVRCHDPGVTSSVH